MGQFFSVFQNTLKNFGIFREISKNRSKKIRRSEKRREIFNFRVLETIEVIVFLTTFHRDLFWDPFLEPFRVGSRVSSASKRGRENPSVKGTTFTSQFIPKKRPQAGTLVPLTLFFGIKAKGQFGTDGFGQM